MGGINAPSENNPIHIQHIYWQYVCIDQAVWPASLCGMKLHPLWSQPSPPLLTMEMNALFLTRKKLKISAEELFHPSSSAFGWRVKCSGNHCKPTCLPVKYCLYCLTGNTRSSWGRMTKRPFSDSCIILVATLPCSVRAPQKENKTLQGFNTNVFTRPEEAATYKQPLLSAE